MRQLITIVLFAITVVFVIAWAIIVAPFGQAGNVADGYEQWLEGICDCKEPS